MTDILSPIEIAQWLRDSGRISHGEAHRLEQRIKAWADGQKAEGRKNGIAESALLPDDRFEKTGNLPTRWRLEMNSNSKATS